jgi:hypothetical protein
MLTAIPFSEDTKWLYIMLNNMLANVTIFVLTEV